ncbi:MAG: GGDEF domain-containing protein [Bdellovibrionales bacterium]
MDYKIFDGFLDGIIALNSATEIIYINDSACMILKVPSQRLLLGKKLLEHVPEMGVVFRNAIEDYLIYTDVRRTDSSGYVTDLYVGTRSVEPDGETLVCIRDVSVEVSLQRKYREEQVERKKALGMALTDPLTKCLNKAGLNKLADEVWREATSNGQPFALVVIDLDDFKKVNDEHGHQVGDEFLVHVATTIKAQLRDNDAIARFGGDEFVLILKRCGHEVAQVVVQRILTAVQSTPLVMENAKIFPSMSMGIGVFSKDLHDWQDILRAADQAVYESKKAGKNRLTLFKLGGVG